MSFIILAAVGSFSFVMGVMIGWGAGNGRGFDLGFGQGYAQGFRESIEKIEATKTRVEQAPGSHQ